MSWEVWTERKLLSGCEFSLASESWESAASENELTKAPSSISCRPKENAAARLLPISCTTLAAAWRTGLEKLRNELSNLHPKQVQDKRITLFPLLQGRHMWIWRAKYWIHSCHNESGLQPSHYKFDKRLRTSNLLRFIFGSFLWWRFW